MAQLQFREAMRILFVLKENNNVDFIQQFPRVTSSAILESTQEHNQRNERCLRGGMHERNLHFYAWVWGKHAYAL